MAAHPFFKLPSRRRMIILAGVILAGGLGWLLWSPGTRLTDGRHDRGRNGLWMQHGWLGGDEWFIRLGKTERRAHFHDPAVLTATASLCRQHHITDVFPHLCPAEINGALPDVNDEQVERFLDAFGPGEFRVLPWIGGNRDNMARVESAAWRARFAASAGALLQRHPRLAGVHVNIEPCPSGDADFLKLLNQLRVALPEGKVISVAAYPPPTMWQQTAEVHWEQWYFGEVARRCDQMVVMMYDTSLRSGKLYQNLMRAWTRESIAWAGGTQVLLGVPAYDDAGAEYHDPSVENLPAALRGIHGGLLGSAALPENYQGVAIYSDWEMMAEEWQIFREEFVRP